MMPPPIVLAAAILLGWPLLKIAATLASRPLWKRARALAGQLKMDMWYDDAQRALIDDTIEDAKGEPLQILMPISVLAGGVALVFAHSFSRFVMDMRMADAAGREASEMEFRLAQLRLKLGVATRPPRGPHIWTDERYRLLEDLSFRLSLLRYPVASLLTGLAALIVSPLIFVAEGLRAPAWRVVQHLVRSSAYSSKVFAHAVGVIS